MANVLRAAVVVMIGTQLVIAASGAATGEYRKAGVGLLISLTNVLIFC